MRAVDGLAVGESSEEIGTGRCSIVRRRLSGPEAHEVFLVCRPVHVPADATRQAEVVYRALAEQLRSEGASFAAVARETLFVRNGRRNLGTIAETRRRVLEEVERGPCPPVTTAVEQPPLDDGALLQVSLQAVIPRRPQSLSASDVWWGASAPGGDAQARPHARLVRLADETSLHSGSVYGPVGDPFDEAYGMFCAAEDLLREVGMDFRHVVRTWIHLRHIDRDYAALNRARRLFFRQRGVDSSPASTGIGGGPAAEANRLCLSVYAVRSAERPRTTRMSAATLGEACVYGSDFARGLKVVEANKVALHVSGTASIDEAGHTVHRGDVAAQADRMLTNVASLLAGQGASFHDVLSAVTYVKDPSDALRLREVFATRGFGGFPNALVRAPICRPDLLCETEVLAAMPLDAGT